MFFKRKKVRPNIDGHAPNIGEGKLVYAIGDIHGRLDLLTVLMETIIVHAEHLKQQDYALEGTIVFVGDYIDRGQHSKQVIDYILYDLPDEFDVVYLKGNHEEMLLAYLEDAEKGYVWTLNGGTETLRSYGILRSAQEPDVMQMENLRKEFIRAMPTQHYQFLRILSPYQVIGDYCFVHAGLRPGVPIDNQEEKDLLWIRQDFLGSDFDFGKVVVHGHTPEKEVQMRSNRIGIDTGAFMTNILTAVALYDDKMEFLQAGQ